MIALIEQLLARGHAYEAEGHVLFHVPSDPEYGKLSRRSVDEMRAGARVEVAPYKRDPMDFVLWKPSSESEPGWESPWGYGRPGWHLECSAMSEKHLGRVFDIHGGGIDLLFPHHENELAQSTCAHGTQIMANFWMHNGHLQVEGEKMSKSLGNFVTINELLQDWPGEAIRFAMLHTHYRQPMNWTLAGLEEAKHTLDNWYNHTADAEPAGIDPEFLAALGDDLNTPQAIFRLHQLRSEVAHSRDANAADALKASARLFGLLEQSADSWFSWKPASFAVDEGAIRAAIEARTAARKAKNWAEADRIRDELAACGIALKDSKDPATGEIVTTWEIAR
jgi:cysteinyl-tRNA synthetase